MKQEFIEMANQLEGLANQIKEKLDKNVTDTTFDLNKFGIKKDEFEIIEVALSQPRVSSTAGLHKFYDAYLKIILRNSHGKVEISHYVYANGCSGLGDPTTAYLTYNSFDLKNFESYEGQLKFDRKYVTWEDLLADLDDVSVQIEKISIEGYNFKQKVEDEVRTIVHI